MSKQTRNKQTNKNSRFRINRISVLVVLVLLLQLPVLLLVFKQKIYLSIIKRLACGWWCLFFLLCLSGAAALSASLAMR
jgi:succinate dehydrogenase hydrophobic anchor subunit